MEVRVTDLQPLANPEGADVLLAVDVSADRDSKLTITALQAAVGSAFAPVAHQHPTADLTNFDASSRAQVEATLAAGANITLTPSGSGATRRITIAGAAGGGGGGVSAVTGNAPISVANGTTTPAVSIAAATTGAPGSMSGADKTKLDAVAPGATANSTDAQLRDRATHTGSQLAATISDFTAGSRAQVEATLTAGANITLTPSGSGAARTIAIASTAAGGGGGTVTSVTGTAPIQVASGTTTPAITITPASGSAAGSMSSADFTKLAGVAQGATANATDAQLRDRATHTGSQAGSTVTGLYSAAGLTVSAQFRLLGRTAAGAGPASEVGVGYGLGFVGGNVVSFQATDTVPGVVTVGTGILATAGQISINRAVVDTWYAPAGGGGGATNLDGLSDVSIPLAPGNGEVLGFNGGFWRNLTAAGARLVGSNPTGITGAAAVTAMLSMTQAAYDALPTKAPATFYVIV